MYKPDSLHYATARYHGIRLRTGLILIVLLFALASYLTRDLPPEDENVPALSDR